MPKQPRPGLLVLVVAVIAVWAMPAAGAPAALLVDRGGTVLTGPQVSGIYLGDYWLTGQGASDALHTDAFIQTWLAGPGLTDVLAQYRVGAASFISSDKVSAATPAQFTDDDAQALVKTEIATRRVVSVDQAVYVVYLPPGTVLTFQGVSSLGRLGGYHSSYVDVATGTRVYYAVVVYSQGGNGLDITGNAQENLTIVTSRVLAGAFTDPDAGQGAAGWTDDANGEVGDIAFALTASPTLADVFVVQDGFSVVLLWSNKDEKLTAGTAAATPPPAAGSSDFSLSPTTQTVAPGASVTYTVTSAATVTETLTLAVSGLPANVTGTFAAPSIAPGASTTLTVSADAAATLGATSFTVTGTGATTSQTATATVTVSTQTTTPAATGATDFSLSVTPSSAETTRGGEAVTYVISTEQVGPGSTRIRLKVQHLRRGLRAYLSRSTIGGGETVTLTILPHRDAPRGVQTFEVKGTSKGGDQRATLTLTVQ